MTRPPSTLLILNAGSSSLKFAVFDAARGLGRVLHGQIEPIGGKAKLRVAVGTTQDIVKTVSAPDHAAAIDVFLTWFEISGESARTGDGWLAVGHRVVHGGPAFADPRRIDPAMIETLRGFSAFDPEHMPAEIALIEIMARRFPDMPQIACFDTAFHHDLPPVARVLPIPRRYMASGVRRYGFHGLSYAFAMSELARLEDPAAANGRVILAHLGGGASLAAVRNGRSIDTTMGFTPASGVPMSARSGDLDPGLGAYLARSEGMSPDAFGHMVNFESGLLGLSETSGDMRDLLGRSASDIRAREAVALFCYQVRKMIGAYAAALEGLDTLVFTGGIGENAPEIRAMICRGLGFLGLVIDPAENTRNAPLISSPAGRVKIRVIHADEELVIARSVAAVLGLRSDSRG